MLGGAGSNVSKAEYLDGKVANAHAHEPYKYIRRDTKVYALNKIGRELKWRVTPLARLALALWGAHSAAST